MINLGIIGISGRSYEDKDLISKNLFFNAAEWTKNLIKSYNKSAEKDGKEKIEYLVSGGSSFSDHIAVRVFNEMRSKNFKLKLFLPCNFDLINDKFFGTIAAKKLNELHENFSLMVEYNTREEISNAINFGAEIDTSSKSFYSRNEKIALESNILLYFSFGSAYFVSGGTKYTVEYFKKNNQKKNKRLFHLDLNSNLNNINKS